MALTIEDNLVMLERNFPSKQMEVICKITIPVINSSNPMIVISHNKDNAVEVVIVVVIEATIEVVNVVMIEIINNSTNNNNNHKTSMSMLHHRQIRHNVFLMLHMQIDEDRLVLLADNRKASNNHGMWEIGMVKH